MNEKSKSSWLSLRRAFRRFEYIKEEWSKIQWIEEGSVVSYTKIVILATFISGMVLYVADLVVQQVLWLCNAVLKVLFG